MRAEAPDFDYRDLMVGLAPLHDCARRLGVDVAALFAEAAYVVGGEVGDVARGFGRRTDVTPEAFLYRVMDEPDGPAYRWVK